MVVEVVGVVLVVVVVAVVASDVVIVDGAIEVLTAMAAGEMEAEVEMTGEVTEKDAAGEAEMTALRVVAEVPVTVAVAVPAGEGAVLFRFTAAKTSVVLVVVVVAEG